MLIFKALNIAPLSRLQPEPVGFNCNVYMLDDAESTLPLVVE